MAGRGQNARGLAAAILILAPLATARAAPPAAAPAATAPALITGVRFGNHRDFGRVVFDLPPGAGWRSARDGTRLTLRFDGGVELADGISGRARNVRAIRKLAHGAELVIAAGAHARAWRLGNRLVVDVFDPQPSPADSATTRPRPTPPPPAASSSAPPLPTPPPAAPPAQHPAAASAPATPAAPAPASLATPAPAPAPASAAHTAGGATDHPPQTAQAAPVAVSSAAPSAPTPAPAHETPPARVLAQPAPTAAAPKAPPATGMPAPLEPVRAQPLAPATAPATPAVPAPPATPASATLATPPAAPASLAIAARPLPAPPGSHAIMLPFPPGTGAAAFQRGAVALVVFDRQRPIDLAALRDDPAFHGAAITLLPAATVLRLPLPPAQRPHLARTAAGWAVTLSAAAPAGTPIAPRLEHGRLLLPVAAPGHVVSLPDPVTGGTLLVGTEAGLGPDGRPHAGQFMPVERRAPQFLLLPSWQGVAVAPTSDALSLDTARGGFALALDGGAGLALSVPNATALAAEAAASLSRRFDFPDLPLPRLAGRLQAAIDAAAATPPQARGPKRIEVAEALLALGRGVEAGGVLHLAGAEDGRLAHDPARTGLAAIAAILAGPRHPGYRRAGAIDDPRLSGSDEIALWRALRAAQAGDDAAAAPVLAASYRLLLAYPALLAARVLPLAAEAMIAGGAPKAAAALLAARPHDPSLGLARAMLAEKDGHPDAALVGYDRLAESDDRRTRARAAFRAIRLRVARKLLTPAQAADALDRQILAWRGDGHELAVRREAAAMRAAAGQPGRALALLRQTEALHPADRAALHGQMVAIFTAALGADQQRKLPPLQLIALADENPDLLPAGEPGRVLASRLADRLMALQLPDRALPVLQKLADSTPPGDARASLGARIAEARMEQGDAAGALASLAATRGVGRMAPALLERRTLLFARAAAAAGKLPEALAALAALDTPAAEEARAGLLEQAGRWPAARDALLAWTSRVVPPTGALTDKQATALLRLASAAAQAGDEALLARLHRDDLPRLPPGHIADMFRLLTAGPVDALADLGRAKRETQLASRLPDALKSLTSIANP